MAGFKLYEVSGYPGPLRLSEDHAKELGGKEIAVTQEVPSRSASKAEWQQYAITQGMDPDTASSTTRADLIAAYGS